MKSTDKVRQTALVCEVLQALLEPYAEVLAVAKLADNLGDGGIKVAVPKVTTPAAGLPSIRIGSHMTMGSNSAGGTIDGSVNFAGGQAAEEGTSEDNPTPSKLHLKVSNFFLKLSIFFFCRSLSIAYMGKLIPSKLKALLKDVSTLAPNNEFAKFIECLNQGKNGSSVHNPPSGNAGLYQQSFYGDQR